MNMKSTLGKYHNQPSKRSLRSCASVVYKMSQAILASFSMNFHTWSSTNSPNTLEPQPIGTMVLTPLLSHCTKNVRKRVVRYDVLFYQDNRLSSCTEAEGGIPELTHYALRISQPQR